MLRRPLSITAAFVATLAVASCGQGYVAPIGDTQMFITQVRAQTPSCANHPDYPVVGRVSGIMGIGSARGVSFVGCFPTMADCEYWRMPVAGAIDGRLIQNRCEARRA